MTAALNAKDEPIVRKAQAKKTVPKKAAPRKNVTKGQSQIRGGKRQAGEEESGADTEEESDAEMESDDSEDDAMEELEDEDLDVDAVGCAPTSRKKPVREATAVPAAPAPTRSSSGRIRRKPNTFDPLKDGANDTKRRKTEV